MSVATQRPSPSTPTVARSSTIDELVALGWQLNANLYRTVHLAARYDEEAEWFYSGLKSPAAGICAQLQIHANTAREWIRVGHALCHLPLIDTAFAENTISYAKARILTRWADSDNEAELLELAQSRTANRLTVAIAKALAVDENDEDRDARHHFDRCWTSYTNADGMIVIRMVLPPNLGKSVLAGVDDFVRQIAQTPADPGPSAELAPTTHEITTTQMQPVATVSGQNTPADTFDQTSPGRSTPADTSGAINTPLADTLRELRDRWQPGADDDWFFPTLAQQRADAFVAMFLRKDINITTEIVIHVRGDGNTFDDGTPITTNALIRQLDHSNDGDSFIRAMIHNDHRTPLDATNRRRHPTTRQKRVVMETHNHECIDCQTTDLLEFDHVGFTPLRA